MRIALVAVMLAVTACADDVGDGSDVDAAVSVPAELVGDFDAEWSSAQAGCTPPRSFYDRPPAVTIGGDGTVTWRSTFGDVVHHGRMFEDDLAIPPGEDDGIPRLEYHFGTSDGGETLYAHPAWEFPSGVRVCAVTARRHHEN